jgi:hypothetical protein
MAQGGLKRTIPGFQRGKTVYDLDGSATVIGNLPHNVTKAKCIKITCIYTHAVAKQWHVTESSSSSQRNTYVNCMHKRISGTTFVRVITGSFKNSYFFHWLYSPLGPWPLFFSFMIILQTVGLLGRVINSSQGLYLNTGQHRHRINTYTHETSMPCVGFENTIPASKRAKTIHALDRSATVTGHLTTVLQIN